MELSEQKQFGNWGDRFFPAEPLARGVARHLHDLMRELPIIAPHGHTNPKWFDLNTPLGNPSDVMISGDHYVLRMLHSRGVRLDALGIGQSKSRTDPRDVWQLLADHWESFLGTPTRIWFEYQLKEVLGVDLAFSSETAGEIYEIADAQLRSDAFRPCAMFERFGIELLATTDDPSDDLVHHQRIATSDLQGRVIPTFRPDSVVDAEYYLDFTLNIENLGKVTGEDTSSWRGYLNALRSRREFFKSCGAVATDHGHPSAATANLSAPDCEALFARLLTGDFLPDEAELFRAQMLTEMARMSIEDGLVLQLHSGCFRSHNDKIYQRFGRNVGGDIPEAAEYTRALRPLLEEFGNEPDLRIILFTLDEATYSREIAPLAGHYPCVLSGAPWWFHDSPEGITRYRQAITETAGFYNTAGFNDDAHTLLSIPARHDVSRRSDAAFLARMVSESRLSLPQAEKLAVDLTTEIPKAAYGL